jgi:glycogen operon protein
VRWDGAGVNVAVFSEHADAVELCLFDEGGAERRIELGQRDGPVFHGHVRGVAPGTRYGLRAHGPYDPHRGHRFNPAKLLLDPYARAIDGDLRYDPAIYGYDHALGDLVPDPRDSAPFVPRCVVVDDAFPWGDDRRPRTPMADTVIYEAHVRGLTMLHPDVPPELRGSYAALASEPILAHLTRLGVTAIELLPVHHFVSEPHHAANGTTNYWGYNSIGFHAPHGRYSSSGTRGEQVREFKAMVRALHAVGIEVILDVVYNHTAEADHHGPTLSLRGLDNRSYYRLDGTDGRWYVDFTGCGNTLNARSADALSLVLDSLRYWVTEMHVDGFRFDLAPALARTLHEFDRRSPFFDLVYQDPVLRDVKLIAEPWDVGHGGYQVGNFPWPWSEWNGRYRDDVRDFWRGAGSGLGRFASRLTGSSDLFWLGSRRPQASINFVTAHDGFTLADLVSYERKHNEANGEQNRDGEDFNRSFNCGVEGPTEDPDVLELRDRQARNLLVTLVLSSGVPMLLAGDELGNSQRGNNNAYCQDNEISWIDWRLDERAQHLRSFTERLIALRALHPVFRRRTFYRGGENGAHGVPDIGWFTPGGYEMDGSDWASPERDALEVFLTGGALSEPDVRAASDPRGHFPLDRSFLLLVNAHAAPVDFTLPGSPWARGYAPLLDTASPTGVPGSAPALPAGFTLTRPDRSVLVLAAGR